MSGNTLANFVKLGFHPGFGITHTLPRLIGEQRAALMCLTGRRIKAEEALSWGLVDEVVPLSELRAAALRLAGEIAENAPLAIQSTRATMRRDLADAVKRQTDREFVEQNALRQTKDFAEGVRAVAERRDEAIADLGQGFDKLGTFGGVFQRLAKLFYGSVNPVFEVNESVFRPKCAPQLLAGDDLSFRF
jgi:hypothetical protein